MKSPVVLPVQSTPGLIALHFFVNHRTNERPSFLLIVRYFCEYMFEISYLTQTIEPTGDDSCVFADLDTYTFVAVASWQLFKDNLFEK